MQKIFLSLSLLVCFSFTSCGGNSESGNQMEYDTSEPESNIDSNEVSNLPSEENPYKAITNEAAAEFSSCFSEEVIMKMDDFLLEYNQVDTDDKMDAVYHKGLKLFTTLYDAIYAAETDWLKEQKKQMEDDYGYFQPADIIWEKFDAFEGLLGPVVFTCVAECTEIDFTYNQEMLLEKAKNTKGDDDDEFLKMSIHLYGAYFSKNIGGWPVWFNQTWDYGGSSWVGNGSLTKCIKMYQEYMANHSLFKDEMEYFRNRFLDELTYVGSYMKTKEEVLKEFNDILEMKFFNEEESEKIKKSIKKLEDESEEYIQFDCENSECAYG